jgi:hypothetical protein
MLLLLLFGVPMAILGLATYGLIRAFRPEYTQGASYVALMVASGPLALAFYIFFRWKFSYGEGAAASVAIIPVFVWMVGAFAALAALGLLIRFFQAEPSYPYLVVLAFLPCVVVALQPSAVEHLKRIAADKRPNARVLAERDREEGIREATAYHYYTPDQCPNRGAAFVEACRETVKTAPHLPEYETRWGKDWAQHSHLRNLKDCNDVSLPGFDDDESFTKGCLSAVRDMQRATIMRWAVAHSEESPGDCTAAMSTMDSPDLRSLCRTLMPKARMSIGDDWAKGNVVFDGLECQMHWRKSPNMQDYLAGCAEHRPIWEHVDEKRLVTDQATFENLADCPNQEAVAADAASIGCRYRANGGAAARIAQGRTWSELNHVSERATCVDHFADDAFAIDYVHGCLLTVQEGTRG